MEVCVVLGWVSSCFIYMHLLKPKSWLHLLKVLNWYFADLITPAKSVVLKIIFGGVEIGWKYDVTKCLITFTTIGKLNIDLHDNRWMTKFQFFSGRVCIVPAADFDAAKHLNTHRDLLGRRHNRLTLEKLKTSTISGSADDESLAVCITVMWRGIQYAVICMMLFLIAEMLVNLVS